VVLKQISAVRTADYSSAYQQVSSTVQERYDIEAFSDHLRSDYPELSRTTRVEFGPVQLSGRRATVEVYFVLKEGTRGKSTGRACKSAGRPASASAACAVKAL
jgi:hypothetical protein